MSIKEGMYLSIVFNIILGFAYLNTQVPEKLHFYEQLYLWNAGVFGGCLLIVIVEWICRVSKRNKKGE